MVALLSIDQCADASVFLKNRKNSQEYFNSFPQWTTDIEGLNIHFVGLFSEKKDAIPIMFIHGWPGGYLCLLNVKSNRH